MSKLDDLIKSSPIPSGRPLAYLVVIVLSAAIAWSMLTELEEIASAQGTVVPQGDIKIIQHLEGGIVQSISVRQGDRVSAGDPLLQLSLGTQNLNREDIQTRLDALRLSRARYEAQATGGELDFPADVARRRPTIVASERRSFDARRTELASTQSGLRNAARQRELEVDEFITRHTALLREAENVEKNLLAVREKFQISADLLKNGLTTRNEHLKLEQEILDLEKEIGVLKGDLDVVEVAIPRTRSALEEAQERIREVQLTFQREANEELTKIDTEIARAGESLSQASEQVARTVINSPIDGVVKNLLINTIGGVVSPGQPIMEIVPSDRNLVIEAKLRPVDIGFIKEGLPAVVKFATYDFVRYGGLDGVVTQVAPDSTVEDNGNAFFRVIIATDKTYLGEEEGSLQIFPGMDATVDIKTGTKSVAEYLVRPVLKLRYEAFRER